MQRKGSACSATGKTVRKTSATKQRSTKAGLRDVDRLCTRSGISELWVSRVVAYSSQYNSNGWAADAIIGQPRVYPRYGDIQGAWAQGVCDATQYIQVAFDKALFVEKLEIYETLNGGAITLIKGVAASGSMCDLWANPNGPTVVGTARVFSPPIQAPDHPIKGLRINVDCSAAGTWCELDAIKLTGTESKTAPPPSMKQLSLDLYPLVDNRDFADVAFEIGTDKVMAHRAILSARSEYFHKMFKGDFKEGKQKETFMLVTIKDASCRAFLGLMQYLYTNSLGEDIEPETMLELMRVGDRFLVPDLCLLCHCFLSMELTVENVVSLYRSAVEGLPVLDGIRKLCLEFMATHMDKITQKPEFAQLPQPLMLEVIQHSASKMSIK